MGRRGRRTGRAGAELLMRLSIREALATLVTPDEWYEWLWGGHTPPERAYPHTEGAQGDTQ